jgi:hypothetical protein
MRKFINLMLLLLVLSTASVNAQVRIGGTTNPDVNAILDLNPDAGAAATKGLSLPKVTLIDKSLPDPLSAHTRGIMVYNTTASGDLVEGVYFNDGSKWLPLVSDGSANNSVANDPIVFLSSPGKAYLGEDGNSQDTVYVELGNADKTNFKYQWYRRLADGSSTIIPDATTDTLFLKKGQYGINEEGVVYLLYCVVINGSQYGISGTGRVAYGVGAFINNNKWLKIKSFNLGANENMTIAEQEAYVPKAENSGDANAIANDPTVYGSLYQWGRQTDGHELRTAPASQTLATYSTSPDGVGLDSLDLSTGQILPGLAIANQFIRRISNGNDWRQYPESDGNTLLAPSSSWTWGDPGTGEYGNDPCNALFGENWHVPSRSEWSQIVSSSNNMCLFIPGKNGSTDGFEIRPAATTVKLNKPASVFFPATGRRAPATGVIDMYYTRYWTNESEVTGQAWNIAWDGAAATSISVNSHHPRTWGHAVRCVSE